MDKATMDFLNDSVLALFGRADFVGGIDNEALDFGQLESFVHLPAINTSSNNGNTSAITLSLTTVTTAPAHTISTSSASVAPTNAPTHGTLPDSPPDSGSEPPYSPTDLHAINNLNQITYHQHHYPNNSHPANPHQLDQTMHVNDPNNVDCHNGSINGNANNPTSSIHKTEDILLSSTAMTLPNSVTNHMMLQNNDMMMQQNTQSLLGLGAHHSINMGRNNVYRNDGNNLLALNADDDFSCLMNDTMFQMPSNGLNCHQSQNNHQQLQTATSHPNVNSYNPHVLSQMTTAVMPTSHSAEMPHLLNPRKRTMSTMAQQNDYNSQSILENSNEQQSIGSVIPIKRSTSVILPAIKPEPDALSPSCVSSLIEPATPPSKSSSVDACSNVSSCSTSITSPVSTTIMMPGIVESNSSPNLQQQSQGQGQQGANGIENGSNDSFPMQCIRFSPFQQQNWHILCDQSLQELPLPHYRVDADKGFNFSNSDDAFVCQKKNHFQITCHAQAQGAPAIFVRTESGLEKIKSFHLHFYGVKLETPTQTIRIEQSQSDRSKKPFHPVPIDLQNRQVSKITVGRLHFSETTSNNMRKKGRPNPEQRYFQLVVGLHAHTHSGNFPVVSQGSERIIVRASNPGQFESDVELCWQRGVTQDSIFTHANRVGINTDRPDESLVVHGNLKVSGHIVHPSDSRAKQEIGELDTSQQLQNVKRIRVVRYRYDPEFAVHHGLISNTPAIKSSTKFNRTNERENSSAPENDVIEVIDTGVIAQEIREVLPDAVQETGNILLPSGEVINNFLVVNKDRIYMENIGAVKELCKVTGSLENRIEQLERMNSRLVQVRKIDQSDCSHSKCKFGQYDEDPIEPCSNKMIQITIVVLVIIMAICLAAISTLYFVEHNKQNDWHPHQFYLDKHALVNSSYGGNGIVGDGPEGGGFSASNNVLFDNWNDNHIISKKGSKQTHHNTQNGNNSQQSSISIIESGSPNTGSHSTGGIKSNNGKLDGESQSKSTTPLQITPGEVDFEKILPNSNRTNEIIGKQAKLALTKYDNEVTTEKVQLKGKIGESYPGPPEVSNSIVEGPTDDGIEANIIEDGPNPPRNNSKSDSKNVAKTQSNDIENRNAPNSNDQLTESDYHHRERKFPFPIGLPSHCEQIPNRTASDSPPPLLCPSYCAMSSGNEPAKVNQVSEMPEAPENIPEHDDIIETSTAFKSQKTITTTITTTKLLAIERKSESIELSTTLSDNLNHTSVEHTTAKDKIDNSSHDPSPIDDKNNVNKMAIQAEEPVEVRDSVSNTQNTLAPVVQSNYSEKVEPIPNDRTDDMHKPNESLDTNTEIKQQEIESFADAHSGSIKENDIKPTFMKNENKSEKSSEDGVEAVPKPSNGILEPLANGATSATQTTASTPSSYGIPLNAANPACLIIYLQIRSESFNMTIGYDRICRINLPNFNITYNIPLSKYMKEHRFELVFVTQNPLEWTLCSVKEDTGKGSHIHLDSHNITDETMFYQKRTASHASFEVNIPSFGDFERQIEFQANLQPSDLIPCRSPVLLNGNPMQTVLYKINIYRDCTQQ
ncbi:uncharacterized protein LOC129576268 isoform X2 [Sitodiplosis mosellana]|uniref:uncharacterized protein LOC129576268 isoform X2 n=1 Tax=Sitodiplosis mosellana TaxID=263140 RepID=UPI0024453082|nr:uncharacterized protein LOC129576268 isoform X2 [Sitodiplosis mosellana]XP_055316994.1 uncharacterized protein LOC129576268 isoform X2 [Sitodiplosis mosellana]